MTTIDVVGGVYGERCAFPDWDEIFGSAGRAAIGLSSHVDQVRLHTVLPQNQAKRLSPNFDSFGIDLNVAPGKQLIGFDYLHCLSDPVISPHQSAIEEQPPFGVEAEIAVVFGMMECVPSIKADICVYDPQSPSAPKGFQETGSEAKRLAFVANAREIEKLTGEAGLDGAARLLRSEGAEIVISKCGLDGAMVVGPSGLIGSVPAYKTDSVFTIGSGDVFVAAFALAWTVHEMSPLEAAGYASKAVAKYVETSALPILSIEDAKAKVRAPVSLKGGTIYLAGPFRELGQRVIVDEGRRLLRSLGMDVFSPVHDIGHGPAEKVVEQDLKALEGCDAVFVILNGSSPGTLFEVGYAVRAGKPVFCVAQNMRLNDMKLPIGSGCIVHADFVSTLHFVAWRE